MSNPIYIVCLKHLRWSLWPPSFPNGWWSGLIHGASDSEWRRTRGVRAERVSSQLFVLAALRPDVLQWGHTSKFVGHPGNQRTLASVHQRFWWPSLATDVRQACPHCALCKPSDRNSAAPSSSHPHSPMVTHRLLLCYCRTPSGGNTVILIVVYHFSKAVHLVLPKLPSSWETAQLLAFHVFCLHGLPVYVVSDRSPQFLDCVLILC